MTATRASPAPRTVRPLLTLTTLFVAALTGACQGAKLDSLQQVLISVSPTPVDEHANPGPDLQFEFGVIIGYEGECVTLDGSVHATIDGQPAPQWFAGEKHSSYSVFSGEWVTDCRFPSFHVPVASADEDQVTLALDDGTTRIAATFLNLGRAPSITVTPPADGHIHPGSTIGLTYAPATDDLSQAHWSLDGPTVTQVDLSQRQGGSVQFTIPASQPTGPATLHGDSFRTVGVGACDGAVTCQASTLSLPFENVAAVFLPYSANFTIEP